MAEEEKNNTKSIISETNPDVKPSGVDFVMKDKKNKKKISEDEIFEDDEEIEEKNFFRDLLPYIAILVIVILIRSFIVDPVTVDGPSMEDTLHDKDVVILNRLGKYQRFSIIVIKTADGDLVKRIIGLPGDTIEYKNEKLIINDEEFADNFANGKTNNFGPITLAIDEYFVLGDNRENSTDSRLLGPIKEKYIKGTTSFRLLPVKSLGRIDN